MAVVKETGCWNVGGRSAYLIISVACLAPALLTDIPALWKLFPRSFVSVSVFRDTVGLVSLVSHVDMYDSEPKMSPARAWSYSGGRQRNRLGYYSFGGV